MNWLASHKRTILIITVLILISSGVVTAVYFWKQKPVEREVTINFSSPVTSVKIVGDFEDCDDESECDPTIIEKTLEKPGTITLREGAYNITPLGDTVSDEVIEVTVDSNHTSFTLNPFYSDTHLSNLLAGEKATLQNVIHTTYPVSTQYEIGVGRLYKFGEWYATTLTTRETVENPIPDVHFIILHKVDNAWQVAGKPSLYFRYADHPDIPRDIIESVNSGDIPQDAVQTVETEEE